MYTIYININIRISVYTSAAWMRTFVHAPRGFHLHPITAGDHTY